MNNINNISAVLQENTTISNNYKISLINGSLKVVDVANGSFRRVLFSDDPEKLLVQLFKNPCDTYELISRIININDYAIYPNLVIDYKYLRDVLLSIYTFKNDGPISLFYILEGVIGSDRLIQLYSDFGYVLSKHIFNDDSRYLIKNI